MYDKCTRKFFSVSLALRYAECICVIRVTAEYANVNLIVLILTQMRE